jgi:hypothetical protein
MGRDPTNNKLLVHHLSDPTTVHMSPRYHVEKMVVSRRSTSWKHSTLGASVCSSNCCVRNRTSFFKTDVLDSVSLLLKKSVVVVLIPDIADASDRHA